MNRRSLLKNLSLTAAVAISTPAWAKGWTAESLPALKPMPADDSALLIDLVDALIPQTDTAGAKEVQADKYVRACIEAYHHEKDQKQFYTQMGKVNAYANTKFGKAFAELSKSEKADCLKQISMESAVEWKSFFNLLKNYTIQGYMGSDWYMTTVEGYTMAPGFYHGCVKM